MRDEMRERLDESSKHEQKARNDRSDKLIEQWSKRKSIVGDDFQEQAHSNLTAFRGVARCLENFERHISNLTELQYSSAFPTTPQNVMKTIRLGYPNSIRNELFHVWGMESMHDSLIYLSPKYGETKRDAVINTITHQTTTNRAASEIEIDLVDATGATTNYTGTLAIVPVRPLKVIILVDSVPVAVDNGSGVFVGSTLHTSTASTINVTTGAYDITFTAAPGAQIDIESFYDSEVIANHDELSTITLGLTDHQFYADFDRLGITWTDKTELLLGSTLNIDVNEALMTAAAQDFKKEHDYRACLKGYNVAKGNTAYYYNADYASSGSDSPSDHAQFITNAIDRAGNSIYDTYGRGEISKMYGGPGAVSYLKQHKKFVKTIGGKAIGGFKAGSLNGIDVYQVPSGIVPNNELVGIYKDNDNEYNQALSFGVYLPLAYTNKLQYMQGYNELGMYSVEAFKVLNPGYLRRIVISNLPTS